MRRSAMLALSLLLATGIHVDWHLARSHHHRLSLEWRQHWIFAAAVFAVVGWVVARRWPAGRWRVGVWTLVCGVLLAQLVEPVLELAFYRHRFGYPVEPDRWAVFLVCIAVGVPAYVLALWRCASQDPARRVQR